ncbi:MAG: Nif11-like leader peptide family natural product precursor [Candidatus Eremiobacteraeota bacterium]|nr:Nif11-like leader peptide family natural product precursor [Candidatus Eremiobacteraeota bacterium]
MAGEGLDALRARVWQDADLALRLRRIAPERFVDDVCALAAEFGFDVSASELEAVIVQGRQAWMLRWIG